MVGECSFCSVYATNGLMENRLFQFEKYGQKYCF